MTFFVLLVGATVAERWDLIPYAPAFVEAPHRAGDLSAFWFRWVGANNASALVVGVLIFIGISRMGRGGRR